MLLVDGVRFRQWKASSEDEYESYVVANAKVVFGEDSHYFAVKPKLKSFGGVGSIPDGLVVFFNKPYRWAIVEVELSSHPVFEHILAQLNKFMVGYKGPEGKRAIVKVLDEEINRDPMLRVFVEERIGGKEIHRFLSDLVDKAPEVVVVVDDKTPDIVEACERIPEVKRVVEFRVFERVDAGIKNAFLFDSPIEAPAVQRQLSARHGPITAQGEYAYPILESLVEMGGGGKAGDVLKLVHEKMKERLTPADHETLPSGQDIRWKNHAMWERMNLKRKGYLKSDSPRGVWEITETGRRLLAEKQV